jgi:sugar lactone lactonase YvrE
VSLPSLITRLGLRVLSIGAIVVLSLLAVAGPAQAHVYWTNNADTTIGRANLDGTGVNQSLVSGGSNPCGVAVDGAHIYWADANGGSIGRANLDGSGVNTDFIDGTNTPCGIAVDGAHVYWGSTGEETIGRANLDGSEATEGFITEAGAPCGVAVDRVHVYWPDRVNETIGRANLDGTEVNESFIAGATSPCGLAVDGAHLYWGNAGTGTIGRANLDGTAVNQSFIGGAVMPCGVAVDADPIGGGGDIGGGPVTISAPPPTNISPPTNSPPPADKAAQLPTLGKIKIVLRNRRLVARLPASCPTGEAGGCRTTLRLSTAKPVRRAKARRAAVLGSAGIDLRSGQRSTVSIRLARGTAAFARRGILAARIRITSSDAAGNSAARSVTLRLRIPRR